MSHPVPEALAFRYLRRRLVRRRLAQLDARLRVELALLALLIGGFLYWQVRVPMHGLAGRAGPIGVLQVLLATSVLLAGTGGTLVMVRHLRRLSATPEGPAWLALPASAKRIADHLGWESRSHALWVALPAAGVLAAAAGLVPAWWLALAVLGFALLLRAAARLGVAAGLRLALHRVAGSGRAPGLDPLLLVLGEAARPIRRERLPAARWDPRAPWQALWWKDLAITQRLPLVARSALLAAMLWVASWLVWSLPAELALRHFAALGLSLLGAAALAEWLVAMSGSDPFAALRTLPVGLGALWGSRFAWALLGTVVLCAGHAFAATELSGRALRLFLGWSAAASLGISALGVNYGVTLFPRADVAQRLLGLSLALAVAASVMIPLSGWIVLLSAILHSARRLPYWTRLEET
jgi:hypothetical protein